MKVSELITELQKLESLYGDLQVIYTDMDDCFSWEVGTVEVKNSYYYVDKYDGPVIELSE